MEISKEQFEYWRSLPETQHIFEILKEEEAQLVDFLVIGGTIDAESVEKTALQTTALVHRIRGLRSLIMMRHEEE